MCIDRSSIVNMCSWPMADILNFSDATARNGIIIRDESSLTTVQISKKLISDKEETFDLERSRRI